MHMYTFKHIVARFKLPLVVQLLIAANDLVYLHLRKRRINIHTNTMYNSVSSALDSAIAHYKLA